MSEPKLGVHSEAGTLRQVIVSPPGLAHRRLTPDNREDLLATALCTEMCTALIDEGVDKLHFYTLNKPELTRDVCHALGVTPEFDLRDVA